LPADIAMKESYGVANIKGFALKGVLGFANAKKPGAARRMIESLPPGHARFFDHAIDSNALYP
jgi:hypothetical protein